MTQADWQKPGLRHGPKHPQLTDTCTLPCKLTGVPCSSSLTTGARIEGGNNACLGDADCLLLHHLVQLQQLTACLDTDGGICVEQSQPTRSCLTMLRAASLILSNSSMQHTPCSTGQAPLKGRSVLHGCGSQAGLATRAPCRTAPGHRIPVPSPWFLGPAYSVQRARIISMGTFTLFRHRRSPYLCNIGGETDGRRALATGVDAAGCQLVHITAPGMSSRCGPPASTRITLQGCSAHLSSWDFDTPGSPTSSTFISPRVLAPGSICKMTTAGVTTAHLCCGKGRGAEGVRGLPCSRPQTTDTRCLSSHPPAARWTVQQTLPGAHKCVGRLPESAQARCGCLRQRPQYFNWHAVTTDLENLALGFHLFARHVASVQQRAGVLRDTGQGAWHNRPHVRPAPTESCGERFAHLCIRSVCHVAMLARLALRLGLALLSSKHGKEVGSLILLDVNNINVCLVHTLHPAKSDEYLLKKGAGQGACCMMCGSHGSPSAHAAWDSCEHPWHGRRPLQ